MELSTKQQRRPLYHSLMVSQVLKTWYHFKSNLSHDVCSLPHSDSKSDLRHYFTPVSFIIQMSFVMRKPDFCICKNKEADRSAAFVFATQIVQSLYCLYTKFQASSHLVWLYSPAPICVGPGRKPPKTEAQMLYKSSPAISGIEFTTHLISAFVFAMLIVQSLYFLNPKFKAL